MVHTKDYLDIVKTRTEKIPKRFNVGVMLFMACFISYMLRVNLSINVLAMTYPKESSSSNGTNTTLPDYGPRYHWTPDQVNWLIGAYFYGYLVLSLPAGMLSEWFGGTAVIGYTLLASGVITALSPLAAASSFWAIFAIRFLTGVLGGVLYPGCHSLISKWAPPDEKGKFVSALLGNVFGTVITWPMCGLLIETVGWVYAFYVPAVITIVVALVWFYFVSDSPAVHKGITSKEMEYIENSLGKNVSKGKSFPPLLKMITSIPFWALLLLHYGNLWGLFFLITAAPKFITEVLGFNIGKAGVLSSLPYLARFCAGFVFGSIGDYIRRKEIISTTLIRKSFCLFSHIIPGLLLLSLILVDDNPYVYIGIITISLGFNGASTMTNLQNSQDLAPNFAGTVYGVINFCGTSTGFITPMVVGAFTAESNTIEAWHNIFTVGAIAYILPAIIFGFFGSGEIQSWNELKDEKQDSTTVESPDLPTENDSKVK